MPRALERRLRAEARRKHLGRKRMDTYVYSVLNRIKRQRRRGR